MAEESAELFTPTRTLARGWFRQHGAPVGMGAHQTRMVWMACDGTVGVTSGIWNGAGDAPAPSVLPDAQGPGGWFTTVWKRGKKGDYRWTMAMAEPLAVMPPTPDWITGKVADCPARHRRDEDLEDGPPGKRGGKRPEPQRPVGPPPLPAPVPLAAAAAGSDSKDGRSDDGSLVWRTTVMPDGSRSLAVWLYQDGAMNRVLARDIPAPALAPGKGG